MTAFSLRQFLTAKRLRIAFLLGLLLFSAFVLVLDITIREKFEGKRWALPARVYARPLELFPGAPIKPEQLTAELALLGYANRPDLNEPGSFRHVQDGVELVTRHFQFGDATQASRRLRLRFEDQRLVGLDNLDTGEAVQLARLDPLQIGSIYPSHNEDRVLIKLSEAPQDLINALIATEDRKFYSHHGIDPRGLARAVVSTVTGRGVQGGSTLTQQLIKNFYLTSERSLRRKVTELIMAPLLESHYSKDEILEAYLNEIYLAQDGSHAIHGFGLAAHHYFGKPIERLSLAQSALLVAMVKGPSYYDPRRYPARALERRNLVLSEMQRLDYLTQEQLVAAKAEPLGVISRPPAGTSPYPAFLNLVYRQLRRDYREEDLRSEGLRIFTTFDPLAQRAAEQALTTRLTQIEKARRLGADSLQGAVVVANSQNGEVQALVGGRDPRFDGYNRALDAERQIGSLIKPVVYLTALMRPTEYTLITPLDDSPLRYRERGSPDWQPLNYDKKFHDKVTLRLALANSYNVPTARLGLALGVPRVLEELRRLGVEREIQPYASSLLGASNLTPIEVMQMYQTLASGGFRVPPRAIREIVTADGKPLQRYPLAIDQVVDPAPAYLITTALQGVAREGTAQGLKQYLPAGLDVAGKTGTTDDTRDSWFAGYTGDRVAVVWVGRDDNKPTTLSGSSGAMTIWGEMMAKLNPEPLAPPRPDNIELTWIDPATGLRGDQECPGAVQLPFITDSAPTEVAPCATHTTGSKVRKWFKGLFD